MIIQKCITIFVESKKRSTKGGFYILLPNVFKIKYLQYYEKQQTRNFFPDLGIRKPLKHVLLCTTIFFISLLKKCTIIKNIVNQKNRLKL